MKHAASPPTAGITSDHPRLLAVSGVAPWPVRGGFSLRAAHLLEALAERWDVCLVVAEEVPPSLAAWPEPHRHEVVSTPIATSWRPVPASSVHYAALRASVGTAIERWAPQAALLFNGAEFLAFGGEDFPPAVADRIDCGALERFRYIRRARYLRPLKAALETIREAQYERRVARSLGATTVVGEDDAAALRRISGSDTIYVVPNGVHAHDTPAFDQENERPTVTFTGTLSYYANIDAVRYFVRRIWPHVRREIRDARLVLAGRTPSRGILGFGDRPGLEVLPDVPDMQAVLRDAWVTVAPMRCGSGVKNKVLEAWAVGRPAVLTPRGANGLILEEPASELIATSEDEFVGHLVRLLRDRELRHRHGAAAQDQVRRRQTWGQSAAAIELLLRSVSGTGNRGARSPSEENLV